MGYTAEASNVTLRGSECIWSSSQISVSSQARSLPAPQNLVFHLSEEMCPLVLWSITEIPHTEQPGSQQPSGTKDKGIVLGKAAPATFPDPGDQREDVHCRDLTQRTL